VKVAIDVASLPGSCAWRKEPNLKARETVETQVKKFLSRTDRSEPSHGRLRIPRSDPASLIGSYDGSRSQLRMSGLKRYDAASCKPRSMEMPTWHHRAFTSVSPCIVRHRRTTRNHRVTAQQSSSCSKHVALTD